MADIDFTNHSGNWMREGHRELSERCKNDDELAEKLKEDWPAKYYAFKWTPDDPEDK